MPGGKHELRFEFEPTGKLDLLNGRAHRGAQLYVDGTLVGNSDIPVTVP